jgi:hypothetical protein
MTQNKFHYLGNVFGLLIICAILVLSFIDQLIGHDFPCPLCLLQRTAFVGIGLCLCMNIKNGIKTSNYGLMLLTSVLGFSVALRQVFLHVAPGDPGFGPPLLGLHLYNWSAIVFMFIVGLVGIGLCMNNAFQPKVEKTRKLVTGLMILFLLLILGNGVSTFLECGVMICPANPVQYDLLSFSELQSIGAELSS